ncbi:MAG: tRNA pseudouridine(13) synthase TruD [Gemmataceae bacterium]
MLADWISPAALMTKDLPGLSGRIKVHPEDFEVEEIPAYPPCGTGDHLFLWVEKRGMGAEFFHRRIAHCLEIPVGDVGVAGLKDRHAVTRQMVSVPASCEARIPHLEAEGIRVLNSQRHQNKLKTGHLRGNRFNILIREVDPNSLSSLNSLVERLRSKGIPNFYGAQRFGRDGETLDLGLDLLRGGRGKRTNPFLRRLALSSIQSALFNHYIVQRFQDGKMFTVLAGDVMMKWPNGGMFVARDLAVEQARLDMREIIPGGPIFGPKMFPAEGEALLRECQLLQLHELQLESFAGQGKLMAGTRRYTVVYVDNLEARVEEHGVRVRFDLPSGCYATILLGELTHSSNLVEEGKAG